jgi:HEAT repeat protein
MPLDLDEVLDTLAALAGPLGPLGSLEERSAAEQRWIAEGGAELLEALAAIAAAPMLQARLGAATAADAELLLVEAAGALGRQHPDLALARFVPLLADAHAGRATAISVLGEMGDRRAVAALARIADDAGLNDDERIRLACSLGEIGGADACAVLRRMRDRAGANSPALAQEIAIALESARCE